MRSLKMQTPLNPGAGRSIPPALFHFLVEPAPGVTASARRRAKIETMRVMLLAEPRLEIRKTVVGFAIWQRQSPRLAPLMAEASDGGLSFSLLHFLVPLRTQSVRLIERLVFAKIILRAMPDRWGAETSPQQLPIVRNRLLKLFRKLASKMLI